MKKITLFVFTGFSISILLLIWHFIQPLNKDIVISDFASEDFKTYNKEIKIPTDIQGERSMDGTFYYFVDKKENRIILIGPDLYEGRVQYLDVIDYKMDSKSIKLQIEVKDFLFKNIRKHFYMTRGGGWGESYSQKKFTVLLVKDTKISNKKVEVTINDKQGTLLVMKTE